MVAPHQPTLADRVDRETAVEILKEATRLATTEELEDVGRRLETKASLFRETFRQDRILELSQADLDTALCHVFSVRTRRKKLLREVGIETLRERLADLLYGEGPVGARFAAFVASTDVLDPRRTRALASEVLHFTFPSRHWLWTPWIWDPAIDRGVLRVLTQPDVVLEGPGDAERYDNVGRATLLVAADGHDAGYARLGRGLLGADAFMATAYAVTLLTLYKVNISVEFKRLLPQLPELARRLLGVQHL